MRKVARRSPQGELLLVASRDFILDEHGEKIRVGKLGVNGFAITRLEGIEDAGVGAAA